MADLIEIISNCCKNLIEKAKLLWDQKERKILLYLKKIKPMTNLD